MKSTDDLDFWEAIPQPEKPAPEILSVSQITKQIRRLLEREMGEIWIKGEISNLRAPGSGHLYMSLKDEEAVINAVMFRAEAARLTFRPEDGLAVQVFGKITVYESRGQYQIIVQEMLPQGKGSLQEKFEALKRKLQAEGLFALERKRALPVFPERVGIVTALQGAVLQDFCRILARRAPGIVIHVHGTRVQGFGAAEEIAARIADFNRRREVDLIVIARGGGSLEDLWTFNEEVVARALAASVLPTISAIGHETDFTIADFVADLRAPTPSAAAELLTRDWAEWSEVVEQLSKRLLRAVQLQLQTQRERWRRLAESYVFREPAQIIRQWQQRVDEVASSLGRILKERCEVRRHALEKLLLRWNLVHPQTRLCQARERLDQWEARLKALGPEATLGRGFALMTDQAGKVIRRADHVSVGNSVTVRLAHGKLGVTVNEVEP